MSFTLALRSIVYFARLSGHHACVLWNRSNEFVLQVREHRSISLTESERRRCFLLTLDSSEYHGNNNQEKAFTARVSLLWKGMVKGGIPTRENAMGSNYLPSFLARPSRSRVPAFSSWSYLSTVSLPGEFARRLGYFVSMFYWPA